MTKRILVTGSRQWPWERYAVIARALFDEHEDGAVLVTGGCPTGADDLALAIWRANAGPTCTSEIHPADWDRYGRSAGPRRNQAMVDLGADVCLAFVLPGSRGTWDCVRKAKAAGIPTKVYR